jgi:ectoine hydroxylase-related dioxygenase (phytanoyl-CoA dioxygenase family)
MAERTALLTSVHVADYERDGFVIARQVLADSEIERLRAECERIWAREPIHAGNPRVQWRGLVDGARVADRLDPIVDLSPLLAALSEDPRLFGAAATLLGDAAALFKDKVIMKRPGTLGYGMHQDYPYWEHLGVPAGDYLTFFFPLDPFDAESGSIEVFPGLHGARVPPPSEDPLDADERAIDLTRGQLLAMSPGDMMVMHSLTPHRSPPNRTFRSRRVLIFSYTKARHVGLRARYAGERAAGTGRR